MVRKETIAIVTLLVTIAGLFPFSGMMELLITPSFKVVIDSYMDSEKTHYQRVTVENIGLKQAKNAEVSIRSAYPIKITESYCVEGNFLNDNSTLVQIKFERFSQNVLCYAEFLSQYDKNISIVEVTADDTEGYRHHYGEETLNFGTRAIIISLSILVVVFLIMLIRKKQKSHIVSYKVSLPTVLGLELVKKYGQGFTEDDEDILRAIKRDKNTLEEIAIFTNLNEGYIQGRLEFMREKEALYEINGIWDFEDDSIKKKIPE